MNGNEPQDILHMNTYMMGGPERSRQVSQIGLMCCDIIQAAFQ